MREEELLKLSPDEARAALNDSPETLRRSAAFMYEARHGVRLYSEPASTPGDNIGAALPNSVGAWAWILIVIGVIVAGGAFFFDVSVSSGAGGDYGLPERVANIDKIAVRHMILALGLGLLVCGHILLASDRVSKAVARNAA